MQRRRQRPPPRGRAKPARAAKGVGRRARPTREDRPQPAPVGQPLEADQHDQGGQDPTSPPRHHPRCDRARSSGPLVHHGAARGRGGDHQTEVRTGWRVAAGRQRRRAGPVAQPHIRNLLDPSSRVAKSSHTITSCRTPGSWKTRAGLGPGRRPAAPRSDGAEPPSRPRSHPVEGARRGASRQAARPPGEGPPAGRAAAPVRGCSSR